MNNLTTGQLIDALHRVRTAAAAGDQNAAQDLPLVTQAALRDPNIARAVAQIGHGPVEMGQPGGAITSALQGTVQDVGSTLGSDLRAGAAGAERLVAPPLEAGARLGVRAINDFTGSPGSPQPPLIDPARADMAVQRLLTPPAPQTMQEAQIRALQGRAAGAIDSLVARAPQPVQNVVGTINRGINAIPQPISDAATVLGPLAGAEGALPAAEPASLVARAPADVAKAAGYTGLRSRADLATPGAQAITDKLIAKDAGIVDGAVPNVAAVQNARKVGPGRVYDAVKSAIPQNLTANEQLTSALKGLQDSTSQLPRSPDVQGLQDAMLAQPTMTSDQLFSNIQQARERAATNYASEDPDKQALGKAYSQLASSYEDFAESQLPQGSDLRGQFPQARVQFAKNYMAEKALRGEHFDPMVYARAAQKDPELLSGNGAIVANVANNLPATAPASLSGAIASAAGSTALGTAIGHAIGHPFEGGIGGLMLRDRLANAGADVIQRLRTRGNPDLAAGSSAETPLVERVAGAAENPALSYFRSDPGSPFAPRLELTPPAGSVGITPQQSGLELRVPAVPTPAAPARPPAQGALPLNPALVLRAPEGTVGGDTPSPTEAASNGTVETAGNDLASRLTGTAAVPTSGATATAAAASKAPPVIRFKPSKRAALGDRLVPEDSGS